MSSRLDGLPERRYRAIVERLARTANELKTAPQFVGGASMLFKIRHSGAGADWSGQLVPDPQSPSTGWMRLLVSIEAQNMDYLYATQFTHLWVDGNPERYTIADYLAAVEAGQTGFLVSVSNPVFDAPRQRAWVIGVFGPLGRTVAVKTYLRANDAVTMSVVEALV